MKTSRGRAAQARPLASSLELGTAPFDVTPVTMRDALAEAARLRESQNPPGHAVGPTTIELRRGHELTKSPMTRPQKAATLAHLAST